MTLTYPGSSRLSAFELKPSALISLRVARTSAAPGSSGEDLANDDNQQALNLESAVGKRMMGASGVR
jgi:hypothetical protein